MTTVLAQAVVPTARTVRWRPAAAVAGVLVLVAVLTSYDGRPADTVMALAATGLAAIVVAGLQDPAADLLAPLPVSTMRRRVLRLALVGGPAVGVWWLLTALTTTAGSSGPGPMLALAGCGVAVAVWAPPGRAVLIGACTPVALFTLQLAPTVGAVSEVLGWWRTDPWWVLCVALAVCVAGRRR